MRGLRTTTRTAAILCAALGLTAAVGTASAAPAASPRAEAPATPAAAAPRAKTPVLVDCLWHPKVRPHDYVLACGDGNSRLTKLTWDRWNARSAKARGVNVVNDCKPYCAAGRFHAYPVVVRLDKAETWKKHPRQQRYGRITLEYPADRPAHFPRVVSYPLWD
ncbi:hypothetical protein ACFWNK_26985 [Streptomyces sp. NPDC058417]|uniref:hypothetical protein n=1 Tax=unclassified Streptomyces TaxID=2593676 RepID=UPI0036538D14